MNDITRKLLESRDEAYREFQSSLVPGIKNIIGVRAPVVRAIAKSYAGTPQGNEFLKDLPHKYYDENLAHAYMLGILKTPCIEEYIREFLPYMDNWAVVDCCASSLKGFFKDLDSALEFVKELLKSGKEFVVRFGIVSLLCYYLTDDYVDRALDMVRNIKSDKFYIKMAQAWFFATALTRHYERTLPIIEGKELDFWVHNKSIQKAKESLRIPKEQKEYLNTLRVRRKNEGKA